MDDPRGKGVTMGSTREPDQQVVECSMDEVAERLSAQEGRTVTVAECRKLECQALRKLRAELSRRGLVFDVLIPK
jgi:hypothetical protein